MKAITIFILVFVLTLLIFLSAPSNLSTAQLSINPLVGITTRVSVASDGTEGNSGSVASVLSADGRYVVFDSSSSNLVPNDTNNKRDIFVHDRQTGQTTRISIASDGTQGNDISWGSSISPDGRYITFTSVASNMVPSDTNNADDVFLHDRENGLTTLISVTLDGTLGNGDSSNPAISADGRYVAYFSYANNIVADDTNLFTDVFVFDRQTGQNVRVSVASDGTEGNGDSALCSISSSGRFVAFHSDANNLVADDTNGVSDVFVHDRQTVETIRVSVTSDTTEGNGGSWSPAISADGRFIAFASDATNLVTGDTNAKTDIFIHDRNTGLTKRVSIATNGTEGNDNSVRLDISADGRYVTFDSRASNLINNDTNETWDIYVHDTETSQTTRVSVATDNTLGNDVSWLPAISADGRYVTFASDADNLITGDTNNARDIFMHDRGSVSTIYTISGRVTDNNNNPVSGVIITAGEINTDITDISGNYIIAGLITDTYLIRPSKIGYVFSPPTRNLSVPPDGIGVDFIGTENQTGVDLFVDHIEVRQVFVSDSDPILNYDIPLIANKVSLVRVYVGITGAQLVRNVTAHLFVRDSNGQTHEMKVPIGRSDIIAYQSPNPLNLSSTINFHPLPGWLEGEVTFWAEVDPENQIIETDETNNISQETPETFQASDNLSIAWVAFGFNPYYPIPPTDYVDYDKAARGDRYLSKIYPIGEGNLEYFFQPGFSEVMTRTFTLHRGDYFQALSRFWDEMKPEDWVGGSTPNRLYGWYPRSAREKYGKCGEGPGPYAIGPDYCDKKFDEIPAEVPEDQVFAHEIGHTLGLYHAPNDHGDTNCFADAGAPDPTFPQYPGYPWGSIGIDGLDPVDKWIYSPGLTYDFMSYCWSWWISPYYYQKLTQNVNRTNDNPTAQLELLLPERQILVSGFIYTPTFSVDLDPFYTITSTLAAENNTGTDFCFEMRDVDHSVITSRCFNLGFVDTETGYPTEKEGFSLVVPYPITTTQVVLTHTGTTIESVDVSSHAPTVSLIYPNGGETWSATGTYTVTWSSSDIDGDLLFHKLYYSANGGDSWVPVAYDIPDKSYPLDLSYLPGGSQILLRIGATDGTKTSYDVSDGFIAVGNKHPNVSIYTPENGTTIMPETSLLLNGKGYDLEDGNLSDTKLIWSSSLDGNLGTGKYALANLSRGSHIITLTVTDNDGNIAMDTRQIFVGHKIYLPLTKQEQ